MNSQWPHDPWVGKLVERYRIGRPLGRGGHGFAYLAYDEELFEYRVLKVANRPISTSSLDGGLRDFLDEGLVLSRLKHPQIVTLRSQGEIDGHRYMVIDFIQGFGLRDILEEIASLVKQKNISWSEALPAQVALALVLSASQPLAYAHKADIQMPNRSASGIAHRDIAPGNLILGSRGDERGKVILIDFGTAKTNLETLSTQHHGALGTIPYMDRTRLQKVSALEGAPSKNAFWLGFRETRHDVYALGVLFFQLLTGRLPFPGEDAPQIISSILNPDRYHHLGIDADNILPGAGKIVESCLVWHHFDQPWEAQTYQYPDASALQHDLDKLFKATYPNVDVIEVLTHFLSGLTPEKITPVASPARSKAALVSPTLQTLQEPSSVKLPVSPIWGKSQTFLTGVLISALLGLLIFNSAKLRERFYPQEKSTEFSPETFLNQTNYLLDTSILEPLTEPIPAPMKSPILTREVPTISSPQNSIIPDKEEQVDPQLFIELQSLVRSKPRESLSQLLTAQSNFPNSIDLRFLKCEALVRIQEWTPELRDELEEIQHKKPNIVDSRLFKENVGFWLWSTNSNLLKNDPGNNTLRHSLSLAKRAYLEEFANNPQLRSKISQVQDSPEP